MFEAAENRGWALIVYLICLVLQAMCLAAYGSGDDTAALYIQFVTFALLMVVYRHHSLLHGLWTMSHLNFFIVPGFVLNEVVGPPSGLVSVVLGVSTVLAFFLGARLELHPSRLPKASHYLFVLVVGCTIGVALTALGVARGSEVFPVLLVLLFVAMLRLGSFLGSWAMVTFCVALTVWVFFVWNGFGRLNVAQWATTAILMYILLYNWRIDTRLVALASAAGPSILGYFRGGRSVREQLATGHVDSNLSPLLFADNYASNSATVVDWSGWLDQVFLLFFIWIPRAVYPDKPIGFGHDYVIREMDVSYVGSGHSVAGTLAGEHFYFLGPTVGALAAVGAVLVLVYLCVRFRGREEALSMVAILLLLQMPTFYWGGMSSASARFFVGGLLILLLLGLRQLLAIWSMTRATRREVRLEGQRRLDVRP